jgi:hypothetical protein
MKKEQKLAGLVLLGFIFGMMSASQAAIISGVVTDILTGAPVDSALVQVKGTTVQAFTDAEGRFTLDTEGATGIMARTEMQSIAAMGYPGMFAPVAVYRANGSVYGADGSLLLKTGIGEKASKPLAKASATVTLVYSHKYYTTEEAPADEGDENVSMQLTMWWPDETNTGVQPGITLTPYDGGSINDGDVIENKEVVGTLDFSASNVTIRNCKIHSPGDIWGINQRSGTNLLVENCEIYSTSSQGELCGVSGSNITVRRCNIYNWENGMSVGSNVLVEDCYIHSPSTRAGAHNDGIQWGGGSDVIIRHNHIDINDETGCINVGGGGSDGLWNIDIYYNLLNGGTYSIYLEGRDNHTPGGIHEVRVIGNVWEKESYTYGPHAIMGTVTGLTWEYNVHDDGTSVPR